MASQPLSQSEEDRLIHLKLKIKAWEKDFVAKNDGKVPSKTDIEANPKISSRYAEYRKLRSKSKADSFNSQSQSQSFSQSQLDSQPSFSIARTPKKSSQVLFKTPSKPASASVHVFATPKAQASPVQPNFETPTIALKKWEIKGYVSPTPQKNGKVIGILDGLPTHTPSPAKRKRDAQDAALMGELTDLSSKKAKVVAKGEESESEDDYIPLDPTTPSNRKRRYLIQTPVSKKLNLTAKRPESPDPFATPVFFKRHHYDFEYKDNGSPVTPDIKRFMPPARHAKIKTLSAMIQEMREAEANEEDEGMDVLREMEQAELNPAGSASNLTNANSITQASSKLDVTKDVILSDKVDENTATTESVSQNVSGPTARVYKKKGAKRQTKRVKLRPVRSSTKTTKTTQNGNSSDTESAESENSDFEDLGPNKPTEKAKTNNNSEETDEDNEESGSASGSEDELSATGKSKTKSSKKKTAPTEKKGPARRMRSATQGQNFRAMKLRNRNGSKFKSGRGSFKRR